MLIYYIQMLVDYVREGEKLESSFVEYNIFSFHLVRLRVVGT